MPIPGHVRPLLTALLGVLVGAALHRSVVEATTGGPDGWRVVEAPVNALHASVEGPRRKPGAWFIDQQEIWYARTSLPGQRLRTIALDATLHRRGQLDVWLSRSAIAAPSPGDLLVRLDRHQEQGVSAQVLTWSPDGAHRVGCSPSLPVRSGSSVKLRAQVSEGLLELWVDDAPSVCAVVIGSDPPALQAGHHRVRIEGLEIDSRPLRAPDPGPWWLWSLGGAFLAVMVGRVEQVTGASVRVQRMGEAFVLGAVLLGLFVVQRVEDMQPSVLMALIGAAVLARLSIHVGRALRPVQGTGDWTRTAAIAAVLPAAGLLLLMEPGGKVELPGEALGIGTLAVTVSTALALRRRGRPWRALALMGALLSASTLLGHIVQQAAALAVGSAALAGGGLGASVGGLSRTDHPAAVRVMGAIAGLVAIVCALELSTVQVVEVADMTTQHLTAPHRSARAEALPAFPSDSIVFAGPLSPAGPSTRRALQKSLQRSIHRVGDDRWGLVELNQSLAMTESAFMPDALVLTVGERGDHAEVSERRSTRRSRGGWFPGVVDLALQLATRPESATDIIRAQLSVLSRSMRERDVAVLVLVGESGPDPTAFDSWREAIEQTNAQYGGISVFDIGEATHADSELTWTDARGVLTESGWTAVADRLASLLK